MHGGSFSTDEGCEKSATKGARELARDVACGKLWREAIPEIERECDSRIIVSAG